MAKDTVTTKQLYDAIMGIHEKMDRIVEGRIRPLEVWKAELTGKLAMVGAVFVVVSNIAVQWVKDKFFKT